MRASNVSIDIVILKEKGRTLAEMEIWNGEVFRILGVVQETEKKAWTFPLPHPGESASVNEVRQ